MKSTQLSRSSLLQIIRECTAILCAALLLPGNVGVIAAHAQEPATVAEEAVKIPADQLDSLVAPIALYPDALLSQTLVASTYPLEVIQLKQWLDQNKSLKGKALADAAQKQDWDPSIQALAALPDLVKQLAENIKWTTDLGNAFLAQQSDVMDAVQRMRKKAQDAGNLKPSEQQKVETKVVESKQVVIIEQASPEVVYVPSYNPTVVYGAPAYPYPPIAYPPPGYYAAGMAISFGVGVAMGAFWSGGAGWGCGWGGNNNVYINHNNNFVNNSNRQNINNVNRGNRASTQPARGNSNWQHNPQHRGGAPYSDRATAGRYGGTARGDSVANRQANARQNQARQQPAGGDRGGGNRQPGGGDRGAGTRDTSNRGAGGDRSAGTRDTSNRGAGGDRGASTRDTSSRGASAGNMNSNRGGGGDRVGNRQVPNSPSATNRSAFGGASSGTSGGAARASSSRGSSSMGSSRGGSSSGGGSRGGGGGGRRR
jgi:uncharacterized protein DUF3300